MRKVIGAFILLCVAVVFRSGDILYGPALKLSPFVPGSSVSSRSSRGVAEGAGAPGDSSATARSVTDRSPQKSKNLPPDFIKDPLLFLSTAPPDSLDLLPGIGPVIAERIVGVRTGKRSFTKWDDLLVVKGIGPKTLGRLKGLK